MTKNNDKKPEKLEKPLTDSEDKFVKTLIDEMPEKQDHVIENIDKTEKNVDVTTSPVDEKPKRKRRKKSKPISTLGDISTGITSAIPIDPQCQAAGVATSECIFITGQVLGGMEWIPNENERVMMINSWGAYYQAKGMTDIPPSFIVLTAMLGYVGPRLGKKETQSRLKKLGGWMKQRLQRKRKNQEKIDDSETDNAT